jgi:14-3-3 protein epsilon
MSEKSYTREEYVFLAKLYERAERYDDMVKFIENFVIANPALTLDERNILSAGYKNIIGSKRSSWRLLQTLEKKEEKKGSSSNISNLREIKNKVEDEMRKICEDINTVLDKYLIPSSKDSENKVFYLKLKGDYYRYRAEFTVGKEQETAIKQADKAYSDAYEIAEKDIPISSSTRLGLALNFSVFYYEIKNLKEDACTIARNAFEEAIKVLDDLERTKAKDTILIIQLLKENLILWTNEMNEDEPDNY